MFTTHLCGKIGDTLAISGKYRGGEIAEEMKMIENVQNTGTPTENVSQPQPVGLSQEEINKIVGAARQQGYSRGIEEAKQQYQQPSQPVQDQQSVSHGLTEEQAREIAKQVAEKTLAQNNTQHAWNSAQNEFLEAMQPGYAKYPDFEQKVASLNLINEMPELIHLVRKLRNADDVMYELANNPDKAILLANAARDGRMSAAMNGVRQLSESLETNSKAAKQVFPPDPLSKSVSPSNIGDGGRKTISEWRKNPLLRR